METLQIAYETTIREIEIIPGLDDGTGIADVEFLGTVEIEDDRGEYTRINNYVTCTEVTWNRKAYTTEANERIADYLSKNRGSICEEIEVKFDLL